jgi:hypothetical protein
MRASPLPLPPLPSPQGVLPEKAVAAALGVEVVAASAAHFDGAVVAGAPAAAAAADAAAAGLGNEYGLPQFMPGGAPPPAAPAAAAAPPAADAALMPPPPPVGTPQLDAGHAPSPSPLPLAMPRHPGVEELASEDLHDMFGLDDWISRVPSPPPPVLPAGLGAAPGAFAPPHQQQQHHHHHPQQHHALPPPQMQQQAQQQQPQQQEHAPPPAPPRAPVMFDFAQFQQPLAPSLSGGEDRWELWAGGSAASGGGDGGASGGECDIMHLLYGAPDRLPEMATIQLASFADESPASAPPGASPFGWAASPALHGPGSDFLHEALAPPPPQLPAPLPAPPALAPAGCAPLGAGSKSSGSACSAGTLVEGVALV